MRLVMNLHNDKGKL